MSVPTRQRSQAGFTLLETLIALIVLSVGVLGLAALLATSLNYMNGSQDSFIAQQKAQEAVESIYTARDIQQASWININNTAGGGIFLPGPQPLCDPGPDSIVGTADDDCTKPDSIVMPGPSGKLGAGDDVLAPLSTFKRTITIADDPTTLNLRIITVTVTYISAGVPRSYTLTTLISKFA